MFRSAYRALSALALGLLLATPAAHAADYSVDGAHSVVAFKIRHMMVSWVRGTFGSISGTVSIDPKAPEATKVAIEIAVDSIQTHNAKRDKHLLAEDFFDAAQFPTMRFESTGVKNVTSSGFELVGKLSLHGTTKEVTAAVEGPAPEVASPWGGFKSGASATFVVDRTDFGMSYSKTLDSGGLVVGNEVHITVELELNRK